MLFNCADGEEAELLACKEDLNLELQWISQPISLETDCLTVCTILKCSKENRSNLELLVREVKVLIAELGEVETNQCKRSQNRVSHLFANRACVESLCKVWLHEAPDFVANALATDCNPIEA